MTSPSTHYVKSIKVVCMATLLTLGIVGCDVAFLNVGECPGPESYQDITEIISIEVADTVTEGDTILVTAHIADSLLPGFQYVWWNNDRTTGCVNRWLGSIEIGNDTSRCKTMDNWVRWVVPEVDFSKVRSVRVTIRHDSIAVVKSIDTTCAPIFENPIGKKYIFVLNQDTTGN